MASSAGGHTIIPPSRRPDGSLRKPIRVRAGYVPQDEIAAWESPARRMARQREEAGIPGWDDAPVSTSSSSSSPSRGIVGGDGLDFSPKSTTPQTKSQKRNQARKKGRELKQQSADVEGITAAMAQTKISKPAPAGGMNQQSAQKRTDRPKQGAAAAGGRSGGAPAGGASTADELAKKVKAVQKKLRQVEQLQAKVDAGEITPTPEQLQKLKKKTQFEKELAGLQATLDAAKQ